MQAGNVWSGFGTGGVAAWLLRLAAFVVLSVWSTALAATPPAAPLRGVALVIGQSAYAHLAPLANPANDAEAIDGLLRDLGFDSSLAADRDARRLARDLERFIEDARDADVAVLYYAGHGIEAGGENFLVPVDADLSALDAAGEKLVPISAYVERLKATVPVTILMLDACRDNPFPAGAMVRVDPAAAPVGITAAGLGETRGASRLAPAASDAESYGTVIAFAAEPGRAALDGEPGGNSPYTAAVLRHLDASAGAEFSVVMRLIAEEVYLKTSGRQQPWVNESLRRLLYFGRAPGAVEGPEGDILAERRDLLLTIAALPSAEREQVEAVAREGDVPLDAIYAVLAAMGQQAPADPRDLDRILREQAGRVKKMREERVALTSGDAEIARLLALAEQALGEGALRTAIELNEQAKARVGAIAGIIEDAEEQVRARRLEFGAVHARSAEAYELASDHERAAADYETAFGFVRDLDATLASTYRLGQAWAVKNIGHHAGSFDTMEHAAELAREAADIAWENPEDHAVAMRFLGEILYLLGWHTNSTDLIEEAIGAFEEAMEVETLDWAPEQWVESQRAVGRALEYLSWMEREDDERARALLDEALDHYFSAMDALPRDEAPMDWALTASETAVALYQMAGQDMSMDLAQQSIDMSRQAASIITRDEDPAGWAAIQENIGGAFRIAGQILADTEEEAAADAYRESIASVRVVLATEGNAPADTANVHNNLGATFLDLWDVTGDPQALADAKASYRAALDAIEGTDADALREAAEEGLRQVADEME